MGMNLFLQAFTMDDVDAMERDHSLVDDWVEAERCVFSADVGTAWDVLNKVLDGAGLRSTKFLDDVLWNGCEIVAPALVKVHAEELSKWTHQKVLERLRSIPEGGELYHSDVYKDQADALLEEFDKLVAFYKQAAARDLAVIHYAA